MDKTQNFHNQLLLWVRVYDSLGEVGLEHGRPTLSINQRIELSNRVENGESYKFVALSMGIQQCLLIKWHKLYKEKGIDGLKLLKRGRPSMTKSRKEVASKDPKNMTRKELLEALEMATIENEYLKKCLSSKKEGPRAEEKVTVIDELRLSHKLNKILKVAGLSKSTYEYYKSRKHLNSIQNKAIKEDKILSIVLPIFTHHKKRYGSRRVILAAKDKLHGINHKTIERVMSENNLLAFQGNNGKYHSYKGDNGEAKTNFLISKETVDGKEKLVRHPEANKPNQIWTTDVSEFKYSGGKLYLICMMGQ